MLHRNKFIKSLQLCFIYFNQAKDQYGNEVQKLARPLPVEYLLVDLPTSSPLVPLYTFPAHEHPFPVENRLIDGHLQDFGALHNYMQRFRSQDYLMVRMFLILALFSFLLLKKCFIYYRPCPIFTFSCISLVWIVLEQK